MMIEIMKMLRRSLVVEVNANFRVVHKIATLLDDLMGVADAICMDDVARRKAPCWWVKQNLHSDLC